MLIPFACLAGACHALGAYLFCILPLEYLRPRLHEQPTSIKYLAAFACVLAGVFSGYLLANSGVRRLLGGSSTLIAAPLAGKLAALSLIMVIGVVLLVVAVRTVMAAAELRERALGEAAARAQAQALQAQINPHFFFNTLTTISALADFDSRAAKELVGQLAQLFRYTLSCSQFEFVTLEQELEFVANYLLIEQARFRRRLSFELPPAGTGRGILLPGLTLQPLVENAVRHGIAKRRDGGLIKVGLERDESAWVLSVANQVEVSEGLPPLTAERAFRPGHSLTNTRDRLALAFHGRATLEVFNEGTGWVKIVARLPLMTAGPR
ncbi:MAG: sensor histidine kinase [Bryobacteraceae bacterium]